jgi:hypothetical protein
MMAKTTFSAKDEEQKMKQANEMQLLRYAQEKEVIQQRSKEEVETGESCVDCSLSMLSLALSTERARGIKSAAIAKKDLLTVRAETERAVAEVKEEESGIVRQMRAKMDLEVSELHAKKHTLLAEAKARSAAKAREMIAEKDAYVERKTAEMELEIAKAKAEIDTIMAEAEGVAAAQLAARRAQGLALKKLELYRALASNPKLIVTGKSPESLLAQLLAVKEQATSLGLRVDDIKSAASGR